MLYSRMTSHVVRIENTRKLLKLTLEKIQIADRSGMICTGNTRTPWAQSAGAVHRQEARLNNAEREQRRQQGPDGLKELCSQRNVSSWAPKWRIAWIGIALKVIGRR